MKEEHLETSATEREPLGERALRNADAIAAFVALLVLVLYFAGILLGLPDDLAEIETRLDAAEVAAKTHLAETRFDVEAHQQTIASLKANIESGWSPVPPVEIKVVENVTYPKALVDQAWAGESNEISFPGPVDVRCDARFGVNRITWNVHQDNNVSLSGFKVLRRKAGGSFEEAGQVDLDTHVFDDQAVSPGDTYTYRIVALTEDATVLEQVPESAPSDPVSTLAIADYKITLVGTDAKAKTATFDVEKWHNEDWAKKRFTVKVGDVIGLKDTGSGIDFKTGRVLKGIESRQVREVKPREEVVFDEAARVVVKDGIPVTETIQVEETALIVDVRLEGGGLPPAKETDPSRQILSVKEKR